MNSQLTSMIVESDQLDLSGTLIADPERGTWNIHSTADAKIYLHDSVGIEAAMKLFIWEDLQTSGRSRVKIASNLQGRVIGVVIRSY